MVTFMCCVLILCLTPSHHSTRWEHRFVHTLCAGVIPCRNELLPIFAREGRLVVYLPEWAHEGSVSVFNIKTAQETHIPIIILLHMLEWDGLQRCCTIFLVCRVP
jgi:hypothetical protein